MLLQTWDVVNTPCTFSYNARSSAIEAGRISNKHWSIGRERSLTRTEDHAYLFMNILSGNSFIVCVDAWWSVYIATNHIHIRIIHTQTQTHIAQVECRMHESCTLTVRSCTKSNTAVNIYYNIIISHRNHRILDCCTHSMTTPKTTWIVM